ncbi:hypothetical protein CDD83_9167 [Cordyceps sp. RAO-2017]|nr:hypothetical protein CDD83_9167 [Cordyceps sp. RAO-2017]
MHVKALSALTVSVLAVTVSGRVAVQDSINKITENMAATERSISTWQGGLLTVAPVLLRANNLLNSMQDGVKATADSAELSGPQARAVLDKVEQSGKAARRLTDKVVDAKAKFNQIVLGDVIVSGLMKAYGDAAQDLGTALGNKLPSSKERVATSIREIQDGLAKASKAYGRRTAQ